MPDIADYASDAQALYTKAAITRGFLPSSTPVICEECTMPTVPTEMVVVEGRKLCRECAEC